MYIRDEGEDIVMDVQPSDTGFTVGQRVFKMKKIPMNEQSFSWIAGLMQIPWIFRGI
jgi:hypothetical protein